MLIPLKHNEPDIVVWSKVEKKCFSIDTSVGLDINVAKNLNQKCGNYLLNLNVYTILIYLKLSQ